MGYYYIPSENGKLKLQKTKDLQFDEIRIGTRLHYCDGVRFDNNIVVKLVGHTFRVGKSDLGAYIITKDNVWQFEDMNTIEEVVPESSLSNEDGIYCGSNIDPRTIEDGGIVNVWV